MKDIGLAGLPGSGKTTLFTALTRVAVGRGHSNQAVVDVPDGRLAVLARLEGSRRIVPARVRFVDVPGGLTAHGIAEFRTADALCLVVDGFTPGADPAADLARLESELVLADLVVVDGALAKARKRARTESGARAEADALEAAHEVLDGGRTLRAAGLDGVTVRALRGVAPLSLKPAVVVANVAEGGGLPPGLPQGAVAVSAALEAEVAGMEAAEARELLAGFGIADPGLERVIESSYRALDLITFLTTGEDESRAWEVRRGARAAEAAGVIHSDLERGFIRAEVVAYDDVVSAGSWAAAKAAGLVRVEGKDYVVAEGDVVHIRFAV